MDEKVLHGSIVALGAALVTTGGVLLRMDNLTAGATLAGLGIAIIAADVGWLGRAWWTNRPARPRLRVLPFETVRKHFGDADGRHVASAWAAQIRVVNEPETYGPEATARVIANLTYIDRTNTRLEIQRRWADTPLPEHPDRAVAGH